MRLIILICLLSGSSLLFAQNSLSTSLITDGLQFPVDIANAGDDRLFIVEQAGRIRIFDPEVGILPTPFLDITDRVLSVEGEQGLLGLAFLPDYADNGRFYVNYTTGIGPGESRISSFQVNPLDPNLADTATEFILLTVDQPANNHNGGCLKFGPDGYLYAGFGDGGRGGDPWGNSQNPEQLLGKMLLISVENDGAYEIPLNNPFVNVNGVRDEIWALGLRNPWRFSFDRQTGDLWIADVGQRALEEVNLQLSNSLGGENYGWDCKEGTEDYIAPSPLCNPNLALVEPVETYNVSVQCNSVTGGFVYRGCRYPELFGRYLYADFCQGFIWSLVPDDNGGWTNEELLKSFNFDISTFGEDAEGELYVALWRGGSIYQLGLGDTLAQPVIAMDDNLLSVEDEYASYQWLLDGMIIDGATSSSYQATTSGRYTVVVTSVAGCELRTSLEVVISSIASLPEVSAIQVVPNPFEEEFRLQLHSLRSFQAQLTLMDLNGRLVHQQSLFLNQGAQTQTLALPDLPNGVYWLQVESKEGRFRQKVVKLKP